MTNERQRIEAIQALMAQRNAIGRKNAHLTPRIPATTPEGHAAWHTAAMAAAVRSADTGDNDVLPTRAEDLTQEERAQLSEAFADKGSRKRKAARSASRPADPEEAWKATGKAYLQEARKAFLSRKVIEEFADAYVGPIVRAADRARADWYARELNAQQAAYLGGDHDADFTPSTYEPAGGIVIEKDYDPANSYNGGADAARQAFGEAAAKSYYALDRTGGILTANNDFIGEVAPAEVFYQASHPRSHLLGVLVIDKGTGQPITPPKVTMEGADHPRAKAMFSLYDLLNEVETGLALEAVDAEEGAATPAAHTAAQRAAEFDTAWGGILARHKITYTAPDPTAPKRFADIAAMARKATAPIPAALMHHAPMEHFYHHAEDYVNVLHTTRLPSAAQRPGSDYDTADFLTMVNGLMSLLSKQSQAAGTLIIDPIKGPQMKGWDIVAIQEGKEIRILSASPILSFTANQLIREGRGGTPQKRDLDRMHRLLREISYLNRDEAARLGLHASIINNVTGEEDICKKDPVTGATNYYLTLTNYFLSEQRYHRVVGSWDSFIEAKRQAKGLSAKANTYVTEADMRFVFYLRTLRPGEPTTIRSEILAEKIGRASLLSHNPAMFRADIRAMAEAAKAMDPPLLSSYTLSNGKYTFTTIEQKQTAIPTPPQPKTLPPADGSADPPTHAEG